MMKVVITGANRGLGFEFTKQCLVQGEEVIATCREPVNALKLQSLKETHNNSFQIVPLDVIDYHSIELAYKQISSLFSRIDLLINNAGIISGSIRRYHAFGELFTEDITRVFQVNAIAPLLVTEKFYPLVKNGNQPKLVFISSRRGSISQKEGTSTYSYDASKAALNMFGKRLAAHVKRDNVILFLLHPGWVKTDMRTDQAPVRSPDSIKGMLHIIENATLAMSGSFLDWQGNLIPW